jgi:hypothetical protein
MSKEDAKKRWANAEDLQLKVQLYFVGLIFTLLGASIQTASFIPLPWYKFLEIAAWCCLLLAGLLGLSFLEWAPIIHKEIARAEIIKSDVAQLSNLEAEEFFLQTETGVRSVRTEEHARMKTEQLADRAATLKQLSGKASAKYTSQKIFFAVGIIILVCARAYKGISMVATKTP